MDKNEIKLPQGRFCSPQTLCGACFWLDRTDRTKEPPYYYWCKRVSSYKNPETNTSCPHWNVND